MTLHKIATVEEMKNENTKHLFIEGKEIALFKVKDKFYCTENMCTHHGGSLADGILDETVITCPLHAAQFDVITGKVLEGPATENIRTFIVKIEKNNILVDL